MWGDQGPPSEIRVEWPKNFPAFQDFIMDDKGWLFVRPYAKAKKAKSISYDVFDAKGRYVARVLLTAIIRLIKNGKLYTIEEDEEGLRCLTRYSLEWR